MIWRNLNFLWSLPPFNVIHTDCLIWWDVCCIAVLSLRLPFSFFCSAASINPDGNLFCHASCELASISQLWNIRWIFHPSQIRHILIGWTMALVSRPLDDLCSWYLYFCVDHLCWSSVSAPKYQRDRVQQCTTMTHTKSCRWHQRAGILDGDGNYEWNMETSPSFTLTNSLEVPTLLRRRISLELDDERKKKLTT